MNIKLQKIGDRFYVIVNSVAGEFKEDVTLKLESILDTEVYQRAKKLSEEMHGQEIEKMQAAISGCLAALDEYNN